MLAVYLLYALGVSLACLLHESCMVVVCLMIVLSVVLVLCACLSVECVVQVCRMFVVYLVYGIGMRCVCPLHSC